MPQHVDHECDTCTYHLKTVYRLEQLEKDMSKFEDCQAKIKKDINSIITGQALLSEKLDNLKWPLIIIAAAVLAEVGKWLFSILPATKAAASILGG